MPNGLGYDCAVTINFTIPPSGKAYVNLHLDYGVKGQNTDFNPKDTFADRYDKGTNTCVGDATYYDALQNDLLSVPAGPTALATCTWYPFSHDGGGGSNNGNDSIQNVNSFKKISGAFGQAVSQGNGALYQNIPATLTDSTGKVISTGTTDQDGFYALPYAHKGKPALFTITLGTGATKASKVIELHANGWTEADYDPLTLTWYVSVK